MSYAKSKRMEERRLARSRAHRKQTFRKAHIPKMYRRRR